MRLLALALLLAVPGGAATKKSPSLHPAAKKLMAEGLGALERGEYTAAISAMNKAVRRQGSVSSYFLLGWAHYQRGFKLGSTEAADKDDAQSALDAFGMALSLDPKLSELPDPSRLHFAMAMCHEAVEAHEKALQSYKAALRAAPGKALIPLHAARLRLKMGDSDKAMANIEMALMKAKKAGAEDALRRQARRDPAFAPLMGSTIHRRALGIAAAEDGEMVASLARGEELRDAVRDTPRPAPPAQDPMVLEKLAQGNLEFKFRRFSSAVSAYHEALALDSERGTLGAGQIGAIYERIGTAYNKLGQSELALKSLLKALRQNPMNAQAHYQMALAYGVSGRTSAAVRALKEAFGASADPAELRRLVISSKTDMELEAARDQAEYREAVASVSDRLALR